MRKILTVVLLLLTSISYSQQINISGHVPHPFSGGKYRIQVGAYGEDSNAERAITRLRNAGLNPIIENHNGYRRVILSEVESINVAPTLQTLYSIGFFNIWIRGETGASIFTITTTGNGAVSEITDLNDREPLRIVQIVPSFISNDPVNNIYPANAPIVFFFNDKIYLNSINSSVEFLVDGRAVEGDIIIGEGANGYAVLTLTPRNPIPAGRNVSVVIKNSLQDDGGNEMNSDINVSFTTIQGSQTVFNRSNFGFEESANGVFFTGDGAIIGARGNLNPHEGSRYAAISTGTRIVSSNGTAINFRTSQIMLGPIEQSFSSLEFFYNFISSEFNDYVGSEFDDQAMINISGPKGSHSELITSVNIVRLNNTQIEYHGMPDSGDSYAGQTGWQRRRIENIDVGFPAFITFTVTDVGDLALSSILAVDAIVLE